jgi:hypothetical protein
MGRGWTYEQKNTHDDEQRGHLPAEWNFNALKPLCVPLPRLHSSLTHIDTHPFPPLLSLVCCEMGGFLNLALVSLTAVGVLGDGLHARAKAIGKYMGTEIVVSELNDANLMAIVNNNEEFGSVVPGNEMKVRYPSVQFPLRLTQPDLLVITVGCHRTISRKLQLQRRRPYSELCKDQREALAMSHISMA